MEIFVSEKENVELQLEGRATLRTMVKQSVYGQQVNYIEQEVKSLEQHDKELLQEFVDKLYKDLDTLTKHGYTDDQWEEICISKGDVEDLVIRLLKERGV